MLRRAWIWGLLTVSGLASAGCSCHLSTMPPVDVDIREACSAIAVDSRCHVHLFFLREPDLLDCSGVNDLKQTVEELGFPRAWSGFSWHVKAFEKEILQIHRD